MDKVESVEKYYQEFIKNDELILKTQQRFKRERDNIFTEEINKVTLSSNHYLKMQSIRSI